MIVFFKSYVTVAKTIEVKYRDVLCIGSTKVVTHSEEVEWWRTLMVECVTLF